MSSGVIENSEYPESFVRGVNFCLTTCAGVSESALSSLISISLFKSYIY